MASYTVTTEEDNISTLTMLGPNKEQPAFAAPGFCWSDYIVHRPVYPSSFWERIFTYHAQSSNSWGTAHDVGAGAGIAAQELAKRFNHIIVSDPNEGYVGIASERLGQFGFCKSKFAFLQEGAEESSVPSHQVDLLTICEAFHWTDVSKAMDSYARQLKPGGTLSINFYGMPQLINNESAQRVWGEMIEIWAQKLHNAGGILSRGVEHMSAGLDSVPIPDQDFEAGSKRITVDTGCKMKTLNSALSMAPKQVGQGEVMELIEDDKEWRSMRDVQWLKGFFATLLPRVGEEEIQDLWSALESFADGQNVEISWPLEQILSTKRWVGAVASL
ncbi:S-adenosyl-L-methionine-dependent methyltransferase [Glarea lozoyensis ATCC 20868]|uniref:S-adenosyl-L-methionine-dependent methyltransferase n=1 Tax=Glarea lozoyensis (strain ATCC 20868 / MF5171) TaxID=1116229 RepID=S3DJ58_GLAL2|nr:S-adenosyl-L-methionine-dependent methyltransferase [Glarea lozoyensis ATCC 20868]EPE26583.1 S-adenosyl-L-methionine-dependent methyltransferase [Glarea lozoyensis ATCC 20868]